jgi:ribosomal protein L35
MPKMKTRKAAAKRYSFTGTGKVKYKKQGLRHILTKKAPSGRENCGAPVCLAAPKPPGSRNYCPTASFSIDHLLVVRI